MSETAAVVVLYNPVLNVFGNLSTYIDQISKLFVVDNSDNINVPLVEKIKQIKNAEYIFNGSNIGIAAGLNIGSRKAIEEGFEYLLTMDQDSRADPYMVNNLLMVIKSSQGIGLAAPRYVHADVQEETEVEAVNEILYTMTSGSLLNLFAFEKVGGFLEKLFIDHVDHEYCLRLNKNGFKVIKVNNAVLYHKVGNTVKRKFFLFTFCPSNHPPIRLYYRTRNRLYVDHIYKKTFPNYFKEDIRHFIREIIEIIMYEKDLWNKFKMIFIGYKHYRKNNLGEYSKAIKG